MSEIYNILAEDRRKTRCIVKILDVCFRNLYKNYKLYDLFFIKNEDILYIISYKGFIDIANSPDEIINKEYIDKISGRMFELFNILNNNHEEINLYSDRIMYDLRQIYIDDLDINNAKKLILESLGNAKNNAKRERNSHLTPIPSSS